MTQTLSISQLGKKVGISAKTIRFYEEIGLIVSPVRAENGYRMYDLTVIEELKLIKHARDLGLPIKEIKTLMKGCEGSCEHTKEYVESEIESYVTLLEARIKQLTLLKKRLIILNKDLNIKDTCTDDKYCCNVLYQLSTIGKGGDKNG